MRISLIFCPIKGDVPYPPISLAYLSATLKAHGYEVDVWDLNGKLYAELPVLCSEISRLFSNPVLYPQQFLNSGSNPDAALNNIDTIFNLNLLLYALDLEPLIPPNPYEIDFVRRLRSHIRIVAESILQKEPKVVGFSTYISNVAYTCLLARELKIQKKGIRVVFGGSSTSYAPNRELFLKLGLADTVVVGEGEISIVRLLNHIENDLPLKEIYGPSTAYEEPPSEENGDSLVENLDCLPFPDFDGFDFGVYKYGGIIEEKDGNIIPIVASRGCVGRCKYCSETNYWKYFRQRSIRNVIDEIKTQKQKYNAKYFFFQDSLINGNKKWLNEFCDTLLKEKLNIHWTSYARITGLDTNVLPKLKASGCHMLVYGVEHTSENVIKKSNKDMKRDRIMEVLLHTAAAGIIPVANFIFAFPYEEDGDFLNMLYFVYQPEIMDNIICTFRPFELRVNSDLFINRAKYPIEVKRKHIVVPESLEHISGAIDGINIYWKSAKSDYDKLLETKNNLFWGIIEYQKNRWGDYRKWVRNFHFPEILWERINSSSIPKLIEPLTDTPGKSGQRVIVSPAPLAPIQKELLAMVDNITSLGEISKRLTPYPKPEEGGTPINLEEGNQFLQVKKKFIELTLKGFIRWGSSL